MKIDDYFDANCVSLKVKVRNTSDVLREIARVSKNSPITKDFSEESIYNALLAREKLCSTSFSNGIAIPHCHFKELNSFVIGLITVDGETKFDTPDDSSISLFVFVIGPDNNSAKYFKVISSVSDILRTKEVYDSLMKANNNAQAKNIFLQTNEDSIKSLGFREKSYLRIYIKDDKIFRDVLNLLSGMDLFFLNIFETHSPDKYLASLPIFAGDYNVSIDKEVYLITGIVNSKLINETIRKIEKITGTLDKQDDVLVSTQKIEYIAGHLEI